VVDSILYMIDYVNSIYTNVWLFLKKNMIFNRIMHKNVTKGYRQRARMIMLTIYLAGVDAKSEHTR